MINAMALRGWGFANPPDDLAKYLKDAATPGVREKLRFNDTLIKEQDLRDYMEHRTRAPGRLELMAYFRCSRATSYRLYNVCRRILQEREGGAT